MIEEILEKHRVGNGWYEPDLVMIHDGNYPLLKRYIEGKEMRFPAERIIAVADHFSPPSRKEHAEYLRDFEPFAWKCGTYQRFQGISHELMFHYVKEGMFVVGLDSHSTAYGAAGALSMGAGALDMASILVRGSIWLDSPEVYRIRVRSRLSGFDTAMKLIKNGYDGLWLEIEWDAGDAHKRTVATMMADAGAVSALFTPTGSDAEEVFADRILIGPPGDLRNPEPIDEHAGKKVDEVFIGSCMGGRLEDLRAVSRILDGRPVKSRLIVSPVSMEVYASAIEEGIMESLVHSGAIILNPSCGTCAGIDKGMLAPGETGLFTSTRNTKGRHGGPVFSASPQVAAVSALLGRIPHEEEVVSSAY